MNISSSSPSSPSFHTPATQSQSKSALGGLISALTCCFAPQHGSSQSVPPLSHSGFEHYPTSLSAGHKGKAPAEASSSRKSLTRLNDTPLKRALEREMTRFGYTPAETTFNHAFRQKDARPELASMPDDEYLALRLYTTHFYKSVNRQLRSGQPTKDMQLIVENMQKGLKRLAENPDNVANRTLYRGINKPVDDNFIHTNFRLGGSYHDTTFISASEDLSLVGSSFTTLSVKNKKDNNPQTRYQKSPLLEIESASAVRLGPVSINQDEHEALFGLDARFQVTGKEKSASGRWHIKLSEV